MDKKIFYIIGYGFNFNQIENLIDTKKFIRFFNLDFNPEEYKTFDDLQFSSEVYDCLTNFSDPNSSLSYERSDVDDYIILRDTHAWDKNNNFNSRKEAKEYIFNFIKDILYDDTNISDINFIDIEKIWTE